jgi:hypothetical protein
MCFNDDRTRYTTRTCISNGVRYEDRIAVPRHRSSWRRRNGLGGSYYPARYYARPPAVCSVGGAVTHPVRYAQHFGCPRSGIAGACPYGADRYMLGARAAVPSTAVTVSLHSPLSSGYNVCVPTSVTLPLRHWSQCDLVRSRGLELLCCDAPLACLEAPSPRSPPPPQSYYCKPTQSNPIQPNPRFPCNSSTRRLVTTPISEMEAYPRPRHQYIYTPRVGQRGILTYAGQQANGAPPADVAAGGFGYSAVGLAYAGAGYTGGYGVYNSPSYPHPYSASYYAPSYQYPSYPSYGCYYYYGLYGSTNPLANFYFPYQRSHYQTMPAYGQTAYVYPPGPTTTTTTTYHVTNGHAPSAAAPLTHPAPSCRPVPTREDYQTENRRVATERGAYSARKIMPADARPDDPFWCRERTGEWHLRTYYQIENECHPGQWLMDAEVGYLVFHRV